MHFWEQLAAKKRAELHRPWVNSNFLSSSTKSFSASHYAFSAKVSVTRIQTEEDFIYPCGLKADVFAMVWKVNEPFPLPFKLELPSPYSILQNELAYCDPLYQNSTLANQRNCPYGNLL
jgi:hypothetical protein